MFIKNSNNKKVKVEIIDAHIDLISKLNILV